MPTSICQQFKTHYLHLVQSTGELQAEQANVKQTGDLSTAKEKLETLKQARENMFEQEQVGSDRDSGLLLFLLAFYTYFLSIAFAKGPSYKF